MDTLNTPASESNTIRYGVNLPSITTTTKTEFIGFDGKVIRQTVDANGKPHRIHKVITTTMTTTCFGEEDLINDQTAGEKFVEHVKELGSDTKDVLLHTATNVQHALESATDYLKTQLASTTAQDNTDKTSAAAAGKEQTPNLLQQAAALKDVIVQKAMDVKDATVDVLKDLAAPEESATATTTVEFHKNTATVTTEKKHE